VITDQTFAIDSCTGDIDDPTTLIGPGNSCNIIIQLEDGTGAVSGQWFQLEIKPPIGAPTTIRKTIATGFMGGKLL
jgi:archaellin